MFKNFIKVAFRNLNKYKGFSLINIIGLAIGITCCILILLFVQDELSYDKYNNKAEQIYRVYLKGTINNHTLNTAVSSAPLGATLKNDFPEVLNYARLRNFGFPVMRYKDKAFSEEKFYWADSTFFEIFSVRFLMGNAKTALEKPNDVVITESTARKYFGSENPMGKILNADHRKDYLVTGVIKDFPLNSHFHFDFLASLSTYPDSRNNFWLSNNYYTYILLRKGTDVKEFQKKLDEDVKKYIGPQLKLSAGITFDQFIAAGNRYGYYLQSLTSIHLNSHLENEIEPNSDIIYVYIFSAIAMSILLIACINFMNLSTARSERRSKEVGIRKTLGSHQAQLIRQFITESILMSSLAVFISIFLVEIFLPLFNDIAGKEIKLNFLDNFYTIPILITIAILVGVLAGSYPAFFLSSFKPVQVLKSDVRRGNRKSILRSTLVIFQFAVSIILFIGTFIIYNQLEYIQNKNLGFDKEQVVIIKKTDDIGSQIETFKEQLLSNHNILHVSNSTQIPGESFGNSAYRMRNKSGNDTQILWQLFTDYNFVSTYGIKMNEGRFFSKEHPSDTDAVVINEAAVKVLSLSSPLGKDLMAFGRTEAQSKPFKIIGVMKDFNFESLHQEIRPLVIHLFNSRGFGKFVSVRIAPRNYKNTISYIDDTWKKLAGNEAFEYSFFDQSWAHLYLAEQRTSKISTIFSLLAIFIACLGLLGLASFITEQRTKEIGIRKVLGASVHEIIILLSKEFAKWVLIANLIAWPAAYFVMNNWLQDFAYRININLWIFVSSGIAALVIALLTVSSHAIKAATANPVKSLRYE